MRHLIHPPPPLTLLATALLALTLTLPAGEAHAQATCDRNKCTVRMASVNGGQVVDGYGGAATLGRMKIIFSSTDPSVMRASFQISGYWIQATSDLRATAFSNREWRATASNRNQWQDPAANRIGFAGGVLGANLIEVRPKAGAQIWSNRNLSNIQRSPGELVVQDFRLNPGSNHGVAGSAHFLFTGGKGCATLDEWGETDGSTQ